MAEANKALFFRLVRTAAELATAPLFNPEFTHQVFREDETVFGYRDLKARVLAGAQRVTRPHGAGTPLRMQRVGTRACQHVSASGLRATAHALQTLSAESCAELLRRAGAQIVISLHAVTFHALVEVSHSGTAPSALGGIDNIEARPLLCVFACSALRRPHASACRATRASALRTRSRVASATGAAARRLSRGLHDRAERV